MSGCVRLCPDASELMKVGQGVSKGVGVSGCTRRVSMRRRAAKKNFKISQDEEK